MNPNTVLSITIAQLKSLVRNFKSSGIMFVLPIVFMAIFGIAFGGESPITITVGVLETSEFQGEFDVVSIFESISEESDEINIEVTTFEDRDELFERVDNGSLESGLVVGSAENNSPAYELLFPSQSPSSQINQSILADIVGQIQNPREDGISVTLTDPDRGSLSGFDYLAPGLIIYGIIILIPGIAQSFTEISEKKYTFRFATSKVKAAEIITGYVGYYFVLGIIQVILLYAAAQVFGYEPIGNIFVAAIPALLSLLFVIAIGLLIGSFFDKAEAATNVGTIISIILGFFSGAFISGIGRVLTFDIAGRTYQFNDILPTKWATDAVDKILTFGGSFEDISQTVLLLAVTGIISLVLAAWVYSKRQLKAAL